MSGLAERIVADIRSLAQFEPRENEIHGLDHAYAIQSEVNAALIAGQPARQVAGYKIAFNRRSSMDYYNLSEPCFAPLFSDQVQEDGAARPLAGFRDLVVEAEIAVRLGSALSEGSDPAAVMAAIDAIFPAIEVMDVRGAFARDPSAAAAVAQRVHSEGAVLGAAVAARGLAEGETVARLLVDGSSVGEARNAAPQSPVEAVAWLANRLGRDGLSLQPGMIVLTGAHLPGHPVRAAGTVRVELEPFGAVSLHLV